MRISTQQVYQQGLGVLQRQQAQLQRTQQEVASGVRGATLAEDPLAAVRSLALQGEIAALQQYDRNAEAATRQLSFADTVLDAMSDRLQRFRELVLQANSASRSADSRFAIAVEISAIRDQLLALANTRDPAGDYIFAGFQSAEQPFRSTDLGVIYRGDQGEGLVEISRDTRIVVRDPGEPLFTSIPIGNGRFDVRASASNTGTGAVGLTSASQNFQSGEYAIEFSRPSVDGPLLFTVRDDQGTVLGSGTYVEGDSISFAGAAVSFQGLPADGDRFLVPSAARQGLFDTLDDVRAALREDTSLPPQAAKLNTALASALNNLDQAFSSISNARSRIGARLNQVEAQQAANANILLQKQTNLSEVRDVDLAEAISRLNLQSVALQAAQQSLVRVQGLSLFNFL
jgi:flagellar hook-associated protein 3 FlgL